jgi:hypothetical protein
MYIPELRKVKEHPMTIRMDCIEAPVQGSVVLPKVPSDWVKIRLDGPVTVYAHVWDMEDD